MKKRLILITSIVLVMTMLTAIVLVGCDNKGAQKVSYGNLNEATSAMFDKMILKKNFQINVLNVNEETSNNEKQNITGTMLFANNGYSICLQTEYKTKVTFKREIYVASEGEKNYMYISEENPSETGSKESLFQLVSANKVKTTTAESMQVFFNEIVEKIVNVTSCYYVNEGKGKFVYKDKEKFKDTIIKGSNDNNNNNDPYGDHNNNNGYPPYDDNNNQDSDKDENNNYDEDVFNKEEPPYVIEFNNGTFKLTERDSELSFEICNIGAVPNIAQYDALAAIQEPLPEEETDDSENQEENQDNQNDVPPYITGIYKGLNANDYNGCLNRFISYVKDNPKFTYESKSNDGSYPTVKSKYDNGVMTIYSKNYTFVIKNDNVYWEMDHQRKEWDLYSFDEYWRIPELDEVGVKRYYEYMRDMKLVDQVQIFVDEFEWTPVKNQTSQGRTFTNGQGTLFISEKVVSYELNGLQIKISL